MSSSDQVIPQASPLPIQTKPSQTVAAVIQPPEIDEAEECKTAVMSTDPEVLPQASSSPHTPPPIQTKPSQVAAAAIIQPPEEEECKTPTAPENRIPETLTCPPAPRKKFGRKRRKICDPDYFEDENREEVESFFESSYEQLGFKNGSVLKRKIVKVRVN